MGNKISTTPIKPFKCEGFPITDESILLEAYGDLTLSEDWEAIYNNKGDTIENHLCIAIRSGNLSLLKTILENNPAYMQVRDSRRNSLLHLAVSYNRSNIVEFLLTDIDVNSRDCDENAPIHLAAIHEDFTCLEVLLENNADVNAKGENGDTALLQTTNLKLSSKIILLLRYNADVNIQNLKGLTALHLVTTYENNANLTKLLLEHGADVNIQDKDKQTPLHVATNIYAEKYTSHLEKNNNKSMLRRSLNKPPCIIQPELFGTDATLQLLVTKGRANLNICDGLGKTVLHYAATVPDLAFAVELFVKHGANVNVHDNYGSTPLHLAISSENRHSIAALLGANADVHSCDKSGMSVLKLALHKDLDIIGHMFDNIANLNVTDNASYNVVEKAMKMNVPGILGCLIGRSEIGDVRNGTKENEVTTEYLEKRLNACVIKKNRNICINYSSLLPVNIPNFELYILPLIFLEISRDNKFEQLLQHPSVRTFLKWKWREMSAFFYINFGFFIFTCLNIFLYKFFFYCSKDDVMNIYGYTLYSFMILNLTILLIREGIQLKINWMEYFKNIENIAELVFIVYTLILVSWYPKNIDIRIQMSALGNILIALTMTLIVGHHPIAAAAVHLLRTVTHKFLRYFIIYIAILLSFSYSFIELDFITKNSTELYNQTFIEAHSLSFLRTMGMFTGELNTADFLEQHNNYVSKVILFLFIIFISVIILNLLNGLAISNILEKNELRISHNKARLEYLYNLDRSINFIIDILNRLPKCCNKFIPSRPNQNISLIYILPDYIKYKDLKLKSKHKKHSYLNDNRIHKDAYEIFQQQEIYNNNNNDFNHDVNISGKLEFQMKELQETIDELNKMNIKLLHESEITRQGQGEINAELVEIRKMLVQLTTENN